MSFELLSPTEMSEADRLSIARGPHDGPALMRNAGAAVAREVLSRYPQARTVHVLAGPGNNGGDGFAAARLLAQAGVDARVYCEGRPVAGSDAAGALADMRLPLLGFDAFAPEETDVVVDALFGAGLARAIGGAYAQAVEKANASGACVVAVDLPSGLSGGSGLVLGTAIRAGVTVTFFRLKPGHLLYPGRALCGDTVLADIGIPADVLSEIGPRTFRNTPELWRETFPWPHSGSHKYARGHVGVFSGGPSASGAARLAAISAARAGAGAVTVLSPKQAVQVNAMHLTAVMLKWIDTPEEAVNFAKDRKMSSAVIGPGFGVGERCVEFLLALAGLGAESPFGLVLDADAITSFADAPDRLFEALAAIGAQTGRERAVLTPHEGEFRRLFPDLADAQGVSKPERARRAAERANAVVILKGPDTVIAAPDGRAAINVNATPFLATAGSGDVLAGIVAGLLAQGMPTFEAAAAGVWLHAEAGARFGPGLIAEDLPALLPAALSELYNGDRTSF
ncbi:bifunctional ADP-dependent NAD(P)H-hydrate dehydratase/NAD(P)H-hydrate epimerase [Aquibium oceanicum]|uniref:Bifunctional NAD(P)H-hydrate repair enzyme n=1 Tax=Aquibium oceanicum TaxID=1670800 RepID=A0A1L3SRB5_9HYPH|nr:bifunctional ADP-dependent NAD(P)H-hydrate dehydratase/NAD(P)H-hydrate epimerase [Aquibium oceanicum]APH71910.1 bifunctional ADP-dependent (S)-NAD(P)H-hydrate dehydratase/NAD(P)H-hydrate epimerase [Aquibium oceanicum]